MTLESHRDRKTDYWAEEFDEPINQPRDPAYYMPVTARANPRAFRGRKVA
jgi:hypothetical protein